MRPHIILPQVHFLSLDGERDLTPDARRALCSVTNALVALSMAEIVSAYPIAGGPYFW